jgi:glutaminyl-tRNA synthetase
MFPPMSGDPKRTERETSTTPRDAERGARAPRPAQDEGPGRFIDEIVERDLEAGAFHRPLTTRFPPEPNGYLHIGHAKSICLNFGLSTLHSDGRCNLRFDDTNPEAEEAEFVEAIKADVRWLGFDWGEREYFASDYFPKLYEHAEKLIREGAAYVDSQSLEAIREGRGDYHRPGAPSPFRDRPVEENLDLFRRMRDGEFEDGAHVLRAKGDMASKDMKMRDPLMYRIRKVPHHRTGTAWSIYPMYDWAHGLSDAIEGVTHSICTLEFQNHRPLYEWFLAKVGVEEPPKQIEFARLNLTYTVLSKRKLSELVEGGHVSGWDDPRMPTLAGMRRRGIPPEAIRRFCERIGVARKDGVVDVGLFEHEVREHLNATTPRVMGVLRPLKVVITNFPEGEVMLCEAQNDPEDPSKGSREVPFSRELYIERDDFMEVPMKKWFRLAPGAEVRLRNACLVTCDEVVKDDAGQVVELRCTWDPASRGGNAPDGRKVKGTVHWVSAAHAIDAEVRLYDRLFLAENPADEKLGGSYLDRLNPASLEVLAHAKLEPSLARAKPGERYQFERLGYFCVDPSSTDERPVWNRTITLKDGWAKIAQREAAR